MAVIYPPQQVLSQLGVSSTDHAARYLDVYCKDAQFPGAKTEVLSAKYRGRNIPIIGVLDYDQEFTATFYNDENHNVRKFLLDWMNLNQKYVYSDAQRQRAPYTTPQFSSIHVVQLDYKMENQVIVYDMWNVFPINVSSIEVSADNINQVETITATFSFTYFTTNELNTSDSSVVEGINISSLISSMANMNVSSLSSSSLGSQLSNIINNQRQQLVNQIGNSITALATRAVSNLASSVTSSLSNMIKGLF